MDKPLTLIEHFCELRKRILISFAALGMAAAATFPFASAVLKILKAPALGLIGRLAFFSPQEAFLIYLRISFLCGLIIAMPVILYQLWVFISPAMEEKFRKKAADFVLFSSLVFITGCFFAYFILIPPALKFLLSFAKDELVPVISVSKYISFVSSLILACGLVFQMPVLSYILSKLGVINAQTLRKKYKYAIVVIFITAAIITPTPDAFNMLILAVPMLLLYEVSIWISYLQKSALKRAKNSS